MKLINTNLTEKQFLAHLEQFCRLKTRFDRNNDIICFVYKIKDNKFWLGKYDPTIGKTGGFSPERLNCKYDITQNGRVIVTYRRAKHPSYAVFHFFALAIGLYFCINSFINVFENFKIYELIIALAFLIIGLFGLIIKPKKEWISLEEHLHKVCDIK